MEIGELASLLSYEVVQIRGVNFLQITRITETGDPSVYDFISCLCQQISALMVQEHQL